MKIIFTLLFGFCFSISQGQKLSPDQVFSKYEEQNINTYELYSNLNSRSTDETYYVSIGDWDLELQNSKLLSPKFQSANEKGVEKRDLSTLPIPLQGYTSKGGRVSLTIGDGFIYGFINDGKELYYIEPLSYYSNSRSKDDFIIYNVNDIKPSGPRTCGFTEDQKIKLKTDGKSSDRRAGECFEVEYGLAYDCLMLTKYGSVSAVENQIIGVTNNVNTDYDDTFADELRFVIAGFYNVNCSSGDPWSSSTDPFVLLPDFRSWAPTNMGFTHDVASLWTSRDFDGSTVGLAYNPAVCSGSRYNVLQDFSANANSLRVLTSHELGHNFGSDHDDGLPLIYVMSPQVNNTTTWTAASITAIENYYNSQTCLSSCLPTVPEVNFENSVLNVSEAQGGGAAGSCNEPYIDFVSTVSITQTPNSTVSASVSVSGSSTADLNYDYELLNTAISFTTSSSLQQDVTIRIYDDKVEEVIESIILNLSLNSGPANLGNITQSTISINSDEDNVDNLCCSSGAIVEYGTGQYFAPGIFTGEYSDARSRFILPASTLLAYGLQAGPIEQLSVNVYKKTSTAPFNNFSIGLAQVSAVDLSTTPWYSTSNVYNTDYSTTLGWNDFEFNAPFVWNGTSNLYIEFCFDNTNVVQPDSILGFVNGSSGYVQYQYFRNNNETGCTMTSGVLSGIANYNPNIKIGGLGNIGVETAQSSNSIGRIRSGETAHLYSSDNEIIASIKNIGTIDMECIEASLFSAGANKSNLPFGSFQYSDKTFRIQADNSAVYELSIYYTEAELQTWGVSNTELNLIKSSVPIASTSESNSVIIFSSEVVDNSSAAQNIIYKAIANGPGYFAVTDGFDCEVKGTIEDSDFMISQLGSGILMKNISGDQYLVKVNSSGNITASLNNGSTASTYLMNGDLQLNNAGNIVCLMRTSSAFTEISINNDGVVNTQNSTSTPAIYAEVSSGNFGLSENGAGIVFRNSENECWKLHVDEAGNILTGQVPCL